MILRKLTLENLFRWFKIPKQGDNYTPAVGKVCFGDLRRLTPISDDSGFSLGGATDRYYIEKFLKKNASDIQGHTLEVKDDEYTKRFGGERVKQRTILDIDPLNHMATVIADLEKGDNIPSNTYDCIILTQVIQMIYDFKAAIRTVHRILKPGGVLLITVPGITQIDSESLDTWCWSFTQVSLKRVLAEVFPSETMVVERHGNVLIATGLLYGLCVNEFKTVEYEYNDPQYPVIITAKAVKQV